MRRMLLATGHGPVRRACLACAEVFMRMLAGYLRLGLRAGIYVRGGFGFGEPILGVSDIDLVAVVAGGNGTRESPWSRLTLRWRRLMRMLPGLRHVVYLECYSEPELAELRWTRFTYGLDGLGPRSLLFGDSPRSWSQPERCSLPLLLPDLWPVAGWRLISGPDLRPQTDASPPAHPHLLTWVHLQYWWRLGLRALAAPPAPWVSYACVKLIAEPAKIVLWLEHGERHVVRRQILQRALELLPEERAAFAFALELLDDLGDVRGAPIELAWPCLVRLSARIARQLSADLEPLGATAVRLEGVAPIAPARGDVVARPLGDWTALVWPPGREESFVVGSGSAGELPAVRAAAEGSTPTRFVTLLQDALIVRPGRAGREWFRSVDFDATDPVSAALLDGRGVAVFPNAAGWSASHTAARAVAEHAAWLQLPRDRAVEPPSVLTAHLAGLFSAARAGLFLQSIEDGDPVLTVTFEATAVALADRVPGHRTAVEEAYDSYRAAVGVGQAAHREVLRAAAGSLDELGCYPRTFPHLQPLHRSRLASTSEGVAGA
jgi:hypothetical protein